MFQRGMKKAMDGLRGPGSWTSWEHWWRPTPSELACAGGPGGAAPGQTADSCGTRARLQGIYSAVMRAQLRL